MTENGKTLTYVGVALAIGVVAVLARPRQEPPPVKEKVGTPLFEKFTDADKAASLRIVKYTEDLGEVATFKVAKDASHGLWSIPSHGNYPADAETQMKDAATCLVGLTVLDVASEDLGEHEMYGVIEPDQEKLKPGDKGVGLLVAFEDEAGTNLGSLIIGKEVKGNAEQRFVRVPRQNPVFVVKMATDKLSTKFEDWIEKDLLKINPLDVDRLRMKDHSVVRTPEGFVAQPRAEVAVSLDANGSQWKLDEMLVHRDGGPQKAELLPGEELNKEKLDALKNALSDVKIADVFAKPKGLDASLKTSGDFLNDREAQRSLADRGFVLARDNEVWSANGELQVRLKDGVEYVLRFGNVAGEQQDSKDGKLNRYLFVMARVDESKFPKPTQEELPAIPTAVPAATTPAVPADNPAEKPAAEKPAAEKPDGPGSCDSEQDPAAAKKSADPPPAPAPEKKESANKKEAASADKTPPAAPEQKDAAAPAPPGVNPPAAPMNEEELKRKKLEAERERITKENQRKLEKWNDDKGMAEEKVRELNARFAPWYYVISEDVYKKIHLSRSDILKEGSKSVDEGTGVDAFRKLQKDGVKANSPPGAFPPGAFPPGPSIP